MEDVIVLVVLFALGISSIVFNASFARYLAKFSHYPPIGDQQNQSKRLRTALYVGGVMFSVLTPILIVLRIFFPYTGADVTSQHIPVEQAGQTIWDYAAYALFVGI